ncbi:MAG TPA: FeoC-like transcriptional regulator [Rhodospirillales bacterium]|nr:FeoC-like transcriptional regulator [Rhodospirillales bacterium]
MLTTLKGYLVTHRVASLGELARHLRADPDAVRGMLDLWIRKGKVRRMGGARCSGCDSCPPADFELYEWVGERPPEAAAGGAAPTSSCAR